LLTWSTLCLAQQGQFRNYTVAHGLSQSQVETIVQDQLGYLWAGTHHGLSRFDGHTFVHVTKKDGLAENAVTASLVDGDGRIWWGHLNGGISMYDGKQFVGIPAGKRREGHEVRRLAQDRDGNIWVGVYGAGVWVRRVDDQQKGFQPAPGSPADVRTLHLANERLWIGTDDGLWVTDLVSRLAWVEVDPRVLAGKAVSALWSDEAGRFWIGTANDGLYLRDAARGTIHVTGLPQAPIEDVIGDLRGRIWVGTAGDGLWGFNQELKGSRAVGVRTYSVDEGLGYNQVREFTIDREGNLWFALFGGGIASFLGGPF
jgi:ligand-binding sensor domain-containing protein